MASKFTEWAKLASIIKKACKLPFVTWQQPKFKERDNTLFPQFHCPLRHTDSMQISTKTTAVGLATPSRPPVRICHSIRNGQCQRTKKVLEGCKDLKWLTCAMISKNMDPLLAAETYRFTLVLTVLYIDVSAPLLTAQLLRYKLQRAFATLQSLQFIHVAIQYIYICLNENKRGIWWKG